MSLNLCFMIKCPFFLLVLSMGFEQGTMLVPPWLEPLLNTSFFNVCRIHGDAARSECNMFCLDCYGDAFCFYCRSSRHKDHQVIQVGCYIYYLYSYAHLVSHLHFSYQFWVLICVKLALGKWGWFVWFLKDSNNNNNGWNCV